MVTLIFSLIAVAMAGTILFLTFNVKIKQPLAAQKSRVRKAWDSALYWQFEKIKVLRCFINGTLSSTLSEKAIFDTNQAFHEIKNLMAERNVVSKKKLEELQKITDGVCKEICGLFAFNANLNKLFGTDYQRMENCQNQSVSSMQDFLRENTNLRVMHNELRYRAVAKIFPSLSFNIERA